MDVVVVEFAAVGAVISPGEFAITVLLALQVLSLV